MKTILLLCALTALLINTACSMKGSTAVNPCISAPEPNTRLTASMNPAVVQASDTVASYHYEGAGIALTIPADWDYAIDAHDAEIGQFSITFWPKAQPQAVLEVVHYGTPFGVCGTGLTTQAVGFANGLEGSMGTYADLDSWSYIAFEDDYVAHNEGIGLWWDAYGAQALEILGTAVFGEEAVQ